MKMARCALALFTVVAAACTDPQPATPADDVMAAVKAKLDARVAAIRDYSLEGTARNKDTGAEVRFTYAFSQPQFARATVGDEQTLVFDGNAIVALDHKGKTAARIDKSVGEENLLFAIHQTFSDFACEGWRPPLVRPKSTKASAGQGADGPRWTLAVPIDDPQLKEERLVLRGDGSFVEKSTIDASGTAVAFTRVVEDLVDPVTHLKFPKRWEKKGASGHFDVVITKATVNAGVSPDSFNTNIPDGYAIATKGTP